MPNKKTRKEILSVYERQIRIDMAFWIKYRPSRWGAFLPDKIVRLFKRLIEKKGGKHFVFILALILSLKFFGFFPTLNFIWSNFFRIGLIIFIIPILYWVLAIISVYTRLIAFVLLEFLTIVYDNLLDR